MENIEIAAILTEMATLLEIQGETNPFRIRAYRNAVYTIQESPDPIRKLVEEGADLTELPAIGKDMASHITELVTTGRLSILEEVSKEVPRSLVELTRLPGVGPKKVRKLWDELDITTLDDLAAAASAGQIADLDGFGKKSEEKILEAIERHKKRSGRFRLSSADELIQPLIEYMLQDDRVERLEVAGSYRRRQETVGDIDLLAIASDAEPVMERFTSYPQVRSVEKSGDTRGTVILSSDLQVDLRILPAESYGSALVYFTGSKEHNVELRKRALQRGLSVSEYGVFELAEEGEGEESTTGRELGKRVAGATEEEVYASVGLPWITPELRTNRGELDAAEKGELPALIELEDMRGRPANALHVVGREEHDRGDAHGLRRQGLRVRGPHRPLEGAGHDGRARRGQAARAVEGDRRSRGAPPGDPLPAQPGGGHPGRRNARHRGRDAGAARPGGDRRALAVRSSGREADRAPAEGDPASAGQHRRAPHRAGSSTGAIRSTSRWTRSCRAPPSTASPWN